MQWWALHAGLHGSGAARPCLGLPRTPHTIGGRANGPLRGRPLRLQWVILGPMKSALEQCLPLHLQRSLPLVKLRLHHQDFLPVGQPHPLERLESRLLGFQRPVHALLQIYRLLKFAHPCLELRLQASDVVELLPHCLPPYLMRPHHFPAPFGCLKASCLAALPLKT